VAACDRHRREKVGGAPTHRVRFNSDGKPVGRSRRRQVGRRG
jgi:hypothetical protein